MKARWITLGALGFTVWLVATFGVVYVAIELAEDDTPAVVEAPEPEGRECEVAIAFFSSLDQSYQALREQGVDLVDSAIGAVRSDAANQMVAACSE